MPSTMATIKFLTWNVRGLREKIKRSAALAFLKKQRADVVVLVETHVEGRLQMALRRPWVGWAYHSTHTSHARGVSVLIAKSVHFELCELRTDPEGRYVFLHAKLYGEPFLIMAFYIPPPFSTTVVLEGFTFMSRNPSVQTIWLGDFNTTLCPALDRLQTTQTSAVALMRLNSLNSSHLSPYRHVETQLPTCASLLLFLPCSQLHVPHRLHPCVSHPGAAGPSDGVLPQATV